MAGTVHGTHSILIDTGSGEINGKDRFVAIVKALAALQVQGYCTRIAAWYGTGGTGFDFSNEAAPPGNGAFAVYKWNSHGGRSWEWYMLLQYAYDTTFGGAGTNGAPALILNSTGGSSTSHLGIQTAVAFTSGGAAANPWNGTTNNDGTDYKGTAVGGGGAPVWVAPSGGTLHVWPRSNNTGGSHVTLKQNCARAFATTTSNSAVRVHVLADQDGLLMFEDLDDRGSISSYTFVAPFTPLSGLTIPAPLFMLSAPGGGLSIEGSATIGSTTGTATLEGGVYSVPDARPAIATICARPLDAVNGDFGISKQQRNKQYAPTERRNVEVPVAVYVNDGVNQGMVGFLDPFVRVTHSAPNNAVSADKLRAVLGESSANADRLPRWTVGWDGVTADPGTPHNRTRAGVPF